MKKCLITIICFCMLAILIPAAKTEAASVPWDEDIELKGTVNIGSVITVPVLENYYYQMNVTAGQSYTVDAENVDITIYDEKGNRETSGGYDRSFHEIHNYYAVKTEKIYLEIRGTDEGIGKVSVKAGQIFTGSVTKENGLGDNLYYFTPSLTGEYTFKLSGSEEEIPGEMTIGMMKRAQYASLMFKGCKVTFGLGFEEMTATLQAGQLYAINVYINEYDPYTITLIQKPSVTVAKVKSKKVVSAKPRKAVFTWKKANGVNGYQITYSLKKNFKQAKTINVSAKKTKVTLKKLKKGKKYFVKIRGFRDVEGGRYYGAYSKILKVKIK